MKALLLASVIVSLSVTGDYFLKLASQKQVAIAGHQFYVAMAFYTATALCWMAAMRMLPLATIGIFYSVLTILLLTLLGVVVFGESITRREMLGIALAFTSLGLMSKFS